MSIVVNILNIIVIALFGMTVIHFYNRYTEYFFAMLLLRLFIGLNFSFRVHISRLAYI